MLPHMHTDIQEHSHKPQQIHTDTNIHTKTQTHTKTHAHINTQRQICIKIHRDTYTQKYTPTDPTQTYRYRNFHRMVQNFTF